MAASPAVALTGRDGRRGGTAAVDELGLGEESARVFDFDQHSMAVSVPMPHMSVGVQPRRAGRAGACLSRSLIRRVSRRINVEGGDQAVEVYQGRGGHVGQMPRDDLQCLQLGQHTAGRRKPGPGVHGQRNEDASASVGWRTRCRTREERRS